MSNAYTTPDDATCGHTRLTRVHKYYFGGLESEHWECEDCGVYFQPNYPPTINDIHAPPTPRKGVMR